jgi:hypothetical protein
VNVADLLDLPPFPVTRMHLRIRIDRDFDLPPYAATRLRGTLGDALRQRECLTGAPTCPGCPVAAECVFGRLWEGMLPPDAQRPERFAQPPSPYLVTAPFRAQPWRLRATDSFSWELTLLGGEALDVWPAWVLAARQASIRGLGRHVGLDAAHLERVCPMDDDLEPDTDHPLFLADRGILADHPPRVVDLAALPVPQGPDLRVVFTTPLVLRSGGRILHHFDPAALTDRMRERVMRLYDVWSPHTVRLRRDDFTEDAAAVRVTRSHLQPLRFTRRSIRQPDDIPVEGITGAVEVTGVSPRLAALWSLARWTHCGKNTNFGFGEVLLTPPAHP